MSEKQHTKDEELINPHIQAGDSSGGACLNRHLADTPEQGVNKSCAHRWQAYLQMKGDSGVYDWPKYQSLAEKKSRIETFATGGFPACYQKTLKQPVEGQWNVDASSKPIGSGWGPKETKKNFWWKCYHPYWHEAHHIVPNSTLRTAIVGFAEEVQKGEELVKMIRSGLRGEKYNLNEMLNMIMLPLDKEVADALKLPRHRQTAAHWNHSVYSDHVKGQLKTIFSKLKQELVEHENPKYGNLKTRIETLSKNLYPQIKNSKAASLDAMDAIEFNVPGPIP